MSLEQICALLVWFVHSETSFLIQIIIFSFAVLKACLAATKSRDHPTTNLYKVIMTSLQGAIKLSHEGFRYFLIKYSYLSLVSERNCVTYW